MQGGGCRCLHAFVWGSRLGRLNLGLRRLHASATNGHRDMAITVDSKIKGPIGQIYSWQLSFRDARPWPRPLGLVGADPRVKSFVTFVSLYPHHFFCLLQISPRFVSRIRLNLGNIQQVATRFHKPRRARACSRCQLLSPPYLSHVAQADVCASNPAEFGVKGVHVARIRFH